MQQLCRRPFGCSRHVGPFRHPELPARLVATASVKSQKRLKYTSQGTLLKEPLVVTVLADGSDAWRLGPIIDLIEQGGVRRATVAVGVAWGWGGRQR
jgi:hypothetical protein